MWFWENDLPGFGFVNGCICSLILVSDFFFGLNLGDDEGPVCKLCCTESAGNL